MNWERLVCAWRGHERPETVRVYDTPACDRCGHRPRRW